MEQWPVSKFFTLWGREFIFGVGLSHFGSWFGKFIGFGVDHYFFTFHHIRLIFLPYYTLASAVSTTIP